MVILNGPKENCHYLLRWKFSKSSWLKLIHMNACDNGRLRTTRNMLFAHFYCNDSFHSSNRRRGFTNYSIFGRVEMRAPSYCSLCSWKPAGYYLFTSIYIRARCCYYYHYYQLSESILSMLGEGVAEFCYTKNL